MIYQLENHIANQLKEFFNQFDFIDKVVVFGSRARHDCTPKSDIDLCIYSLEMTDIQFSKLKSEIDELPILYKLDIVHFEKVNKELQDNVERDGKLLFQPKYKLKDIATYINGKAFKPTEWSDNGLPIIRIQNLTDSKKEFNYFDKEVDDKYIIEWGDILISWSATLGVFEWKREKAVLNQHIFKVVFDKNIKVDKKYFIWAIQNILEHFEQYTHGSTMKHITKSNFDNVELYFPTLTKQKKIANALDKANELITLRKESIKKLDELSKSIFIDMFGEPISNPKEWDKEKLINIGEIVGGGTPSRNKSEYFKGDIPWITTVSLNKLFINEKDAVEYITKDAVKNSSTKIIPPNSIMIGMRVGVGKVSISTTEICTNQDIVSLVNISEKVLNVYLHFLINYYGQYFKSQQRGATIQGITISVLKDLNIILPPKDLQNKFAIIIEKIEEQKALYEKELKLLENNFDSLLDESFN